MTRPRSSAGAQEAAAVLSRLLRELHTRSGRLGFPPAWEAAAAAAEWGDEGAGVPPVEFTPMQVVPVPVPENIGYAPFVENDRTLEESWALLTRMRAAPGGSDETQRQK